MEKDRWITVPDWGRFQHYGLARQPIWIKNYTALLHKDEYLELTLAERGVLHGIWLAYAFRRGHVLTGRDLSYTLGVKSHYAHLSRHVAALNHAGFIGLTASRPDSNSFYSILSKVDAGAGAGAGASTKSAEDKARRKAENWIRNGAASQVPPGDLRRVLSDEFHIDDAETVMDLMAQVEEHSR